MMLHAKGRREHSSINGELRKKKEKKRKLLLTDEEERSRQQTMVACSISLVCKRKKKGRLEWTDKARDEAIVSCTGETA